MQLLKYLYKHFLYWPCIYFVLTIYYASIDNMMYTLIIQNLNYIVARRPTRPDPSRTFLHHETWKQNEGTISSGVLMPLPPMLSTGRIRSIAAWRSQSMVGKTRSEWKWNPPPALSNPRPPQVYTLSPGWLCRILLTGYGSCHSHLWFMYLFLVSIEITCVIQIGLLVNYLGKGRGRQLGVVLEVLRSFLFHSIVDDVVFEFVLMNYISTCLFTAWWILVVGVGFSNLKENFICWDSKVAIFVCKFIFWLSGFGWREMNNIDRWISYWCLNYWCRPHSWSI